MALNFLLKRSGTASKRPAAASMALGELDLNYDASTGGVYYKDSAGNVVKVGPCQVSATAPNASPAGSSGNSAGEFWYDTAAAELKLWDGSAWVVATLVPESVLSVSGTSPVSVDNTDPQNPVVSVDAASTTVPGVVQLNDSTSSTSTTEALTANQGYNLQQQIDALSVTSNLTLAGTIDASTGFLVTVTSAGTQHGSFVVGDPLPAADNQNENYFVIVTTPGTMTPPGGSSQECHQGDWWLSDGTAWVFLDVGFNAIAATTTTPGVVQLATDAEVQAGVNTNHAVVSSALQSKISDSTSTTSSTTIASSTAVKAAYDAGVQGQTDAAAAQVDADQALLDAAAAQADADQALLDAAAAQATADAAMPLSGGTFTGNVTFPGSAVGGTILTLGVLDPGSDYDAGEYLGEPLVGGTGTGATANINIGFSGQVSSVTLVNGGTGYTVGDSLTAFSTFGTPWSITVSTVTDAISAVGIIDCSGSVGTAGQVLSSTGAAIEWIDGGGGGATPATPTVEGILYGLSGTTNTGVGRNALLSLTTGTCNTAIGCGALSNVTTGTRNIGIGFNAGSALCTDNSNIAIGPFTLCCTAPIGPISENVAIGLCAMRHTTTSQSSVAIGALALECNTTGGLNTAIGRRSLGRNTTGFCNTAIGRSALLYNSTGSYNVGIGVQAGTGNISGEYNTVVGTDALTASTGSFNIAIGAITGPNVISENCVVLIGNCLTLPAAGDCQLVIGFGDGQNWIYGDSTKAIKPGAGIIDCAGFCGSNGQVLTSTGTNSVHWRTPTGASPATPTVAGTVLGLTCTPLFVTALGNCAYSGLLASGSSSDNVAIGSWTFRNSSGTHLNNVAVGSTAMQCTVGALQNVAIGTGALCQVTGCSNVSVGFATARFALGANCNVLLGTFAGCELDTGTNNVLIGFGTGGATPLGVALISTQSNRIIVGNNNHTCAQVRIAWTVTSDVRDKAIDSAGVPYGLEFINQVNPIAYRWCDRNTNEVTDERLRYGFSAQNLLALETETPEGVIISDDNPDCLQMTDQHLLPVLVNAIKELSAKNDALEARIAALEGN